MSNVVWHDTDYMQRSIFDERAATFDSLSWVTDREFMSEILDAVVAFAAEYPRKVTAFLDVGTGTGQVLKYFARIRAEQGVLEGAEATGIDIAAGMLRIAKMRLRGVQGVTLLNRSIYRHGLEYRTFDFAICRNVFHHLGDPDQALLELRKLIRPSGRLFIVEGVAPDEATLRLWREVLVMKDIGRNSAVLLSLDNVGELFRRQWAWSPVRVRPLKPVPVKVSEWLNNAPLTPNTRRAIIRRIGRLSQNVDFSRRFGLKRLRKTDPQDFQFLKHSALIELSVS